MKIVGTKLDNSDYEKFEDFCIKEGMTKSEVLRTLLKQYCQACEDEEYMKQQEKEKTTKQTVIATGKIIPSGTIILEKPEGELVLESGKIYSKNGTWLGTLRGFAHKA